MGDNETIDVVAEALAQQDQAQAIDLEGGRPPVGAPAFGPTKGAGYPKTPAPIPGSAVSPMAEISTLEDLYSSFPLLGGGDWKLRVERVHPKNFNGVPCAGAICDLQVRLTMDQFRDAFGGGTYLLHVLSPVEATGEGATGYRSRYKLKLQVPGNPTGATWEDYQAAMNLSRIMPGGQIPEVEVKKIEAELQRDRMDREDREKMETRLMEAQKPPAEAIEQMREASTMMFNNLQRSNEAQVSMLAKEIDSLRGQLTGKDHELEKVRTELVKTQGDAAKNLHVNETEKTLALRTQHREDLENLRRERDEKEKAADKEWERRIADVKERMQQQIDAEKQRYADQLGVLQTQNTSERSRIESECKRSIEMSHESHGREIERLKENYDRRIEDLKNSNETERKAMEHRISTEITAIRESERTQAKMAMSMADMRGEVVGAEILRLRDENGALRAQCDALRDKLQKDPIQALTEARDLAAKTGMVDASEIPAAGPEEPGWLQIVKGLGPQIIQTLAPLLERKAVGQAPPSPQQQAAMAEHQRRLAMAQAEQQQQMMMQQQRQLAAPRQEQRQYGPMPAPGYVPRPQQQSVMPLGSRLPIQPSTQTTAVPLGSAMAMPRPGYVPPQQTPPPMPPQAEQAPAMGQAVEQPSAMVEQPAVPAPVDGAAQAPQVFQMVSALEAAMGDGVPAAVFAQQFVAGLGPELAKQLADSYKNAEIIEFLSTQDTGGSGVMQTRSGRKYLEQVLDEARKIVG